MDGINLEKKIISVEGEYPTDEKRYYLPIVLTKECESCKKLLEVDLDSNYLSYPIINKPYEIWFYCEDCDTEYKDFITLRISIEQSK